LVGPKKGKPTGRLQKYERRPAAQASPRGKLAALHKCLKWVLCLVVSLSPFLGLLQLQCRGFYSIPVFCRPYSLPFSSEELKTLVTLAKFAVDMILFLLGVEALKTSSPIFYWGVILAPLHSDLLQSPLSCREHMSQYL